MAHLPDSPASGWDCHIHVFDAAAPVLPGHYRPSHSPLPDIEALAAEHGIGHLVLVQPSVYGTDNSVMLRALEASPGRHRGVAVIDTQTDDTLLDRLHRAGVRGIRFNLVSPTGHPGDWVDDLRVLAPRLRERGWHVQWYTNVSTLQRLVRLQAETGLTFVLDHLAGIHATLAATDPAWAAARDLAQSGAWIKLSALYRLGATAPYEVLYPSIQHVAAMFGSRVVWGSDWPHTSYSKNDRPKYLSNLTPVQMALGKTSLDAVLCSNAQSLYG